MVTQKLKSWDVLQDHPIARTLDDTTKLALLCEYVDLRDELDGMPLGQFVLAYLGIDPVHQADPAGVAGPATGPVAVPAAADPGPAGPPPASNGAPPEAEVRPADMVGIRAVYRFPGRNILTDAAGIARDSGGVVAFTDVDGDPWSGVARDKVYPILPANYREIHVIPREAREIQGWLGGTPAADHPEGDLLRSLHVDFPDFPDRIVLAIVNGKRPYVDRFVQLPNNGFEDDQKPTTRLFGEHCFRVRGQYYVVKVVSP
jgi:hypothetical protein